MEDWLAGSDLLITGVRLDSLGQLGPGWQTVHACHTHMCHVAITVHAAPYVDRPGPDLTFKAQAGFLDYPNMLCSLMAD